MPAPVARHSFLPASPGPPFRRSYGAENLPSLRWGIRPSIHPPPFPVLAIRSLLLSIFPAPSFHLAWYSGPPLSFALTRPTASFLSNNASQPPAGSGSGFRGRRRPCCPQSREFLLLLLHPSPVFLMASLATQHQGREGGKGARREIASTLRRLAFRHSSPLISVLDRASYPRPVISSSPAFSLDAISTDPLRARPP